MRRFLPTALATIALLIAASAAATTVIGASIAELAHSADVILYGVVRNVDAELAKTPDGPFRTAIEVEVLEPLKGLNKDQPILSLLIPGGRGFGRVMHIPGMPQLQEGEEVILLLEETALSYAFAGLGQGVFRIDRSRGEPRAWRDLSGMRLVGKKTELVEPTLGALLDYLRPFGQPTGGDR